MTTNPTTAPTSTDPRTVEHWSVPTGTAWHEDSELLADVHKWRYLRANLDAVYADPGSDRSDLFTKIGKLQDLQGRLARHMPYSFLAAGLYLELAAEAILKKQTDPQDAGGDLGFALALVVRVNAAFEECDDLWINWKDARRTDPNVEGIDSAA